MFKPNFKKLLANLSIHFISVPSPNNLAIIPIKSVLIATIICAATLTSCLKDRVEKTSRYRIYTPIYKTLQQVRTEPIMLSIAKIESPGKIYLKDQYIFLSDAYRGIHVIDNSNPASPQKIGFLQIPRNMDMAVKNNTLYADMYSDLWSIDISNPKDIKLKTVSENVFPQYGTYTPQSKVIISWNVRDTVVTTKSDAKPSGDEQWVYNNDVNSIAYNSSNTSSATLALVYGVGGSMARFAATNDRLYTVGNADIGIFNITDAFTPQFLKRNNLGWGIETIFPYKNNLFVGSVAGVKIFSLTNLDDPQQIGEFGHVKRCDPVVVNDKNAFVTLRAGGNCGENKSELQILSITSLTNPTLVKSYELENPFGLSLDGNTLFICDGTAGLKIYDASDVNNLKLLQTIKDINPYDVIAINGLAIVTAREGIIQYDYKNLSNIKQLSKLVTERN